MPRKEVARSQRERLFAATVACVAEKGYEATRVADLLERSGVSRSAFYEHFQDKEDCLLATFEAVVAKSREMVEERLGGEGKGEDREQRARAMLRVLLELIVEQNAAARLCFCDVYMVGERGRLAAKQAMAGFADTLARTIAEVHEGRELPAVMVTGLVGGLQAVVQSHMRRGTEEELPSHADDLCDWAFAYRPPRVPLRSGRRRKRPPDGHLPPIAAYSQAERIVRALAAGAGERGYPTVTVAEIAARASVSQATFYSHFTNKDAALLAALDSAESQMLGVAMPAARRAGDWPHSVRAAIGGLCAFYAAEPDLARLATVEVYAAGPEALSQREQQIAEIRDLFEPGFHSSPATKSIVADAIIGALWTLLYVQVVSKGPRSLPEIAPLASYMALAPFVGVEEAIEVANGDGRPPD